MALSRLACVIQSFANIYFIDMTGEPIQIDPEGAYLKKAKDLRRSGETEEALKLLAESEGKFGCSVKLLCTRGSVFRVCGRYEEAHQCFDAALAIDPSDGIVVDAKSHAYVYEGWNNQVNFDFEAAHRCFDMALTLTPKSEFALNSKGQAYFRTGNLLEARKCFEASVAINPSAEFAINSLGQICFAKGEIKEAHRLFDSVIKMNPKNCFAINAKARIYMSENDYRNACEYFELALNVDPNNPVASYFVAKLLLTQGKKAEAKKMIFIRLQRPPFNIATLMLFALCTNENDPLWSVFAGIFGNETVDKAMMVYKHDGISVYEAEAARFESPSIGNSGIWSDLHARRPVDGLAAEVAGSV